MAFSDEIGHFEYCNGVQPHTGVCNAKGVTDASGLDGDDAFCFSPSASTRVRVAGCLGTDVDFDGVPYQNVWPGTFSNAATDAQFHPSSFLFTSPLFLGSQNYSRVAFEADLPRIESRPIHLASGTCPIRQTQAPAAVASTRPPAPPSIRSIRSEAQAAAASGSWEVPTFWARPTCSAEVRRPSLAAC